MSTYYSSILFIGVKLASVDELFRDVDVKEYGCEHKVDNHKYCPECGRKAIREYKRKEPKIPLAEDWQYDHCAAVIDDRFYLYYDRDYSGKEVYVGIYSKKEYNPGKTMSLPSAKVQELFAKASDLLDFLRENSIQTEENSFGIHVIPHIS
jgi:hypothetical protein